MDPLGGPNVWVMLLGDSIKAGNDIDMSRQSTQRNLGRNVWENSKVLKEADFLALPPSQKGKQLANHVF